VVYGVALVNRHTRRFIVGHIDYLRVGGSDLDDTLIIECDRLMLIALEIPCDASPLPKTTDRCKHLTFLGDYCAAQLPCPVEVFVQQRDNLRIIQQCYDGLVPILIGFQVRIRLSCLQKARSLNDLQGIGGGG